MFKKAIFLSVMVFCSFSVLSKMCFALQLLTQEDALKKVFGPQTQIVTETKDLAEPKLSKVKAILGGELVHYQKGSKSAGVAAKTSFDFYFALKDSNKTAVALIDEEPGKWGPVKFIVALDLQGVVKQVEVLSYEEKRGQPIARHSFLSQFEGKTSKSPLQVEKDITGISGATISSRCAAFAVKKAIALYGELYLTQ